MIKLILQNGDTLTPAHINTLVKEITSVVESTGVAPEDGNQLLIAIEKIVSDEKIELVDNLTSTDTSKALTAKQGKVLKDLIDNFNVLLTSDDASLDSLQELVDFIKVNKTTLNALEISSIAGLDTALSNKVDKTQVLTSVPTGAVFTDTTYLVGDGGLTERNFTSSLKDKLGGIDVNANSYVHPTNHSISETTGLQQALDNKSSSSHTHNISNISNLQTTLNAKANANQVLTNVPANAMFTDTLYIHPSKHSISDISGLQDALNSAGQSSEQGSDVMGVFESDSKNVADIGVVTLSSSGHINTNRPYWAMNGIDNQIFNSVNGSIGTIWWMLSLPIGVTKTLVKFDYMSHYMSQYDNQGIHLQYSQDGSTWLDAYNKTTDYGAGIKNLDVPVEFNKLRLVNSYPYGTSINWIHLTKFVPFIY